MTCAGKTKIVALTGGIGSGKSTVGEMISKRGFTVIDSDRIARELTAPGSPALTEIVKAFGSEVLKDDGALDRERVANLVFSGPGSRKILEEILHPKIIAEYRNRAAATDEEWVFILIPLLFETGGEERVERIWLCYAPQELRLERTIKRDSADREEVLARMNAQMPDEEKLSRVDVIINTTLGLDDVERQVQAALDELVADG